MRLSAVVAFAALAASTSARAESGRTLGAAADSPSAAYQADLERTVEAATRHRAGAPSGTSEAAAGILAEAQQNGELPPPIPGRGAVPAGDYARNAVSQLGAYTDSLAAAANASPGDARYAAMHAIAAGSRELLAKSYAEMSAELTKLVAGQPKAQQLVLRALLIVSGNKTTAALAQDKAEELKKSVEAMKPKDSGRPEPGAEVEKGDLRPDIPENELRLVAALKASLAEVHAELAAADMQRGAAGVAQAAAARPAEEIGRLDADGRAKAAARDVAGVRLAVDRRNAWTASLRGAVRRDPEELRDAPAPAAGPKKEEVDKAVKGMERMHDLGMTAERSLVRVTASGGPIDQALSAIEVCSRMSLGAVKASNLAVEKNEKTNAKLTELGPRWDAAAPAGEAVEAEAKAAIAEGKKEAKKAEDSGKGALMANQRAMKKLAEAVVAVERASDDLGVKEAGLVPSGG